MAGTGRNVHAQTTVSDPHFVCLKQKSRGEKEADLSLLPGTSHAVELFNVKDNCINEIFMCTHYRKNTPFYNQEFVLLKEKCRKSLGYRIQSGLDL